MPPIVQEVLASPGRPLDAATRAFMEPRLGHDFGRVRVHTDARASESARAVQSLAYTVGQDVVFRAGQYAPGTREGRQLLAHELAHVAQQHDHARLEGAGPRMMQNQLTVSQPGDPDELEADRVAQQVIDVATPTAAEAAIGSGPAKALPIRRRASGPILHRRVSYSVLDWDAAKLGPPTLQNGADPRDIEVPPTGQIAISALVEVNGDATDNCSAHELGTTQTAWIAWTIARYRGQNAGDGHITVRHNATMPMRDPGPAGAVWYDSANIRSPGACGDSVGIFHRDSPWHDIPKMRNNSVVAGSPLNYLRAYTRGLHLVTYLTARDASGTFLRQPLRFVYWNSLQDFAFTPNFANPLQMWAHNGQIRVNIGSKGSGETADAPYYTTAGTTYGDHFNDPANWTIDEQP